MAEEPYGDGDGALAVTVPPTSEPLTLGELKTALQVLHSADDAEITAMGIAAREYVERYTGRQLMTATYTLTMCGFPCGGFDLPRPPLASVTSITYVDGDGATQTVATSVYAVDTGHEPGRVNLKYQQQWPVARSQENAVTVTYVAGYASAALVPATLKQAIKMLVRKQYDPEFVNANQRDAAWELALQSFLISEDVGTFY